MTHKIIAQFVDSRNGDRVSPGDNLPEGMSKEQLDRLTIAGCLKLLTDEEIALQEQEASEDNSEAATVESEEEAAAEGEEEAETYAENSEPETPVTPSGKGGKKGGVGTRRSSSVRA